MQHYKYAVFKSLYPNPVIHYLKLFFGTHIKTTYGNPKTIWYSLRYNAGEKFILRNYLMYPYTYMPGDIAEETTDPVNLSTKLLCSINEKDAISYFNKTNKVNDYTPVKNNNEEGLANSKNKRKLKSIILKFANRFSNTFDYLIYNYRNYNKSSFKNSKKLNLLDANFESSFQNLHDIVRLNENANLPAAVYARIIYASAKLNESGYNHLKLQKIDNETLKNVLQKFIKKIEYADNESIAQVIYSMNSHKYYNNSLWNELLNNLKVDEFSSNYTSVVNKSPFIFRYTETKENKLRNFDKLGNLLFGQNQKTLFETFNAILNANSNKVLNASAIKDKLASEYESVLKDNYHSYVKSL